MRVLRYEFAAGTSPEPLTWTVEDSSGAPLDLSNAGAFPVDSVTVEYRVNGGPTVTVAGQTVNLAGGIIGWTPGPTPFAAPGVLEGTAYYHSGADRRDGARLFMVISRPLGSTP